MFKIRASNILNYYCPIKNKSNKKLGLFPFAGFSPFPLFSGYHTHPNNYEQKYTFYRTAVVFSGNKNA